MKLKNKFSSLLKIASIGFFSVSLTSCLEGGGSGSVSIGSGSPIADGQISISITKVQGLESANWSVDPSGRIYLKSTTVNIQGVCTRGVMTVVATVNGLQVSEFALCKTDGTFSWDKSFTPSAAPLGSSNEIIFQALAANGATINNATTTKTLVIDSVAPTAPVLNNVAGCSLTLGSWVCTSPNIQVSGSWSAVEDVVSLQPPGAGVLNQAGTSFTFDVVLSDGQSRTLDFTVTDRAGNISGSSSVSTVYSPSVNALATSVNTGGTNDFSGGPLGAAPSMIGNVGTLSGESYDLNSGLPINQRIKLQIGPVAIGAQQNNP